MKRLFVLLVAVLVVVFGWSQVKNPDIIFDATIGEADTLDPHHAYDAASGEVIFNVYDNLVAYDGESLSKFVPMLSAVVPSVENGYLRDGGTTYVFPIREGVKFHNGNDLTPEDVEYTFERGILYAPAGGPMWMFLDPMFGVSDIKILVEDYVGASWDTIFDDDMNPATPEYEDALVNFYYDVIDPAVEVQGNEVHVHLARPFAPFLNVIAAGSGWGAILDKEYSIELGIWDGNAEGWWKYHGWTKEQSPYADHAMGTGPYKLVEWDHAQQRVTLERNDDYWRGPAPIRRIIIQAIEEWSTRRAMLETGDADIIDTPVEYLDIVKSMKDVTVFEGTPEVQTQTLQFNWTINPESPYIGSGQLDGEGIPTDFFRDENVRLGFAYSFDYEGMIEGVLNGLGARIPTALPSGFLGFDETLPLYEFDLQKAEEYFKLAYNGRLWQTGFKMSILYNTGNDTRRIAAENIRDNLEKINPRFQVEVRGVPWATYLDQRENLMMPAFVIAWIADYPDPHNFIFTYYHSEGRYGLYYGENYVSFATLPRSEFVGQSLNDMIEKAAIETDPQKREEIYIEVQKFVSKYAVCVPLYQPEGIRVQRSWLKGWIDNPIWPGDYYYLYTKED
ncbi:peptide ABC transporter substrate-binding protein [Petrotoga sp. 9T1HF07.CasAA.8.2]|jgi:peptide/nickel transport system substrate-binding protein|uniref:ABC transporter substrate-binding protein n=1 Tax=Petrotoga sp. 9T1HF07.CasAA.8.2 TaxID=1434329 RepID=UPI000CBB7414|nr:ABC transporter substrate-binding protein [Petrotoga sp. 9T1HF07.CasAA.8.2]PNR87177.1 peptide ABC transporter substrate-binding protein [Petrotoga sp. 9T1HF07.CasAA.8.2]